MTSRNSINASTRDIDISSTTATALVFFPSCSQVETTLSPFSSSYDVSERKNINET